MPQNTLSYYCSLCVDQPISAEQLIAGNQPKDQLQSYTFFLIADYCHVGIVQISLQEWRNCPARMARLRAYFVWHECSLRME